MTRDGLLDQLRPLDEPKVKALASSLLRTAREAPQTAIEVSLGDDESASIKARRLLLGMEDLAIVPLVEAPSSPAVEDRMFMIKRAVEAEIALRRKVIARIDALLDDRSPVPVTISGPIEVKPPPRRVCDEAYLLMRRMVHFGEAQTEAAVDADMFLKAPDEFKNAEIRRARASSTWNRAITGKDMKDFYHGHPDARIKR
jgi:hypothetical protein